MDPQAIEKERQDIMGSALSNQDLVKYINSSIEVMMVMKVQT